MKVKELLDACANMLTEDTLQPNFDLTLTFVLGKKRQKISAWVISEEDQQREFSYFEIVDKNNLIIYL